MTRCHTEHDCPFCRCNRRDLVHGWIDRTAPFYPLVEYVDSLAGIWHRRDEE